MMLLALLLTVADVPQARDGFQRTHELHRLTHSQAERLVGRRAFYSIRIESLPDREGDCILYDCQSPSDVHATAWLPIGQELAEAMTVEATLRIIVHQPSVGADGTPFVGFTEYRLTLAMVQ